MLRKGLTDDRQEAEVQVAREDTSRKFAKERLEQTSNSMWVPVLVGAQEINVALCSTVVSRTLRRKGIATHHY